MPEYATKFKNSVTLLKDTEYTYDNKIYFVDTVIKVSYYTPGKDFDWETPTVQIMIDLAAMSEQLYKKYPELIDTVSFMAGADSSYFPGTEDQGVALFPVLTTLN